MQMIWAENSELVGNDLWSRLVQLSDDDRVTVWHISLYMAIFLKWRANFSKNPVAIKRREIMKVAHIGSVATYHKCLKELTEFGYLDYVPSYHPSVGSQIYLH
jgi:hypothetical protein